MKLLVDDFAKYLYLPRVKNAQVILDAIQDGVSRLTWSQDTFAYADYFDATGDRYRGTRSGSPPDRPVERKQRGGEARSCCGPDRKGLRTGAGHRDRFRHW